MLIHINFEKADKQNPWGEAVYYHCNLEGICPFLQKGQCIALRHNHKCFYSQIEYKKSPTTMKSKKYKEWENKITEEYNLFYSNNRQLTFNESRIALIGEYIFIPSFNAGMNYKIPFIEHSALLNKGMLFIEKNKFTPEVLIELVNFIPRGAVGKIVIYQDKEVPQLLYQLKHTVPDIYEQAALLDPSIENRILKNKDLKWGIPADRCPPGKVKVILKDGSTVVMDWDGESLSGQLSPAELCVFLMFRNKKEIVNFSLVINDRVTVIPSKETADDLFERGEYISYP